MCLGIVAVKLNIGLIVCVNELTYVASFSTLARYWTFVGLLLSASKASLLTDSLCSCCDLVVIDLENLDHLSRLAPGCPYQRPYKALRPVWSWSRGFDLSLGMSPDQTLVSAPRGHNFGIDLLVSTSRPILISASIVYDLI